MQCAGCGFVDDSVTPADAAVALRSYPRRYRAVLVRPDDEDADPEAVVRRPASDGWSALDHAAHVVESLRAVAEALRLVSIDDDPLVALEPERPAEAGTVEQTLDRLTTAVDDAATAVERIKGKDWERRARSGPGESATTALDLARHGVHEGVHHLRGAESAVSEAVSAR